MSVVLVVEDDPINRTAFARILTSAGFDVTTAEDGLAGLHALNARAFDAVVCDIRMPLLSGKGFYEQLEESFPHTASRVVFVTAYADDPILREFFGEAGQPVLQKPPDMYALIAAVREVSARPFG
jgi:CheY-like chemotaxis protein